MFSHFAMVSINTFYNAKEPITLGIQSMNTASVWSNWLQITQWVADTKPWIWYITNITPDRDVTFCPGRPASPGSPWPKRGKKDEKGKVLPRIASNLLTPGYFHKDSPTCLLIAGMYSVTLHLISLKQFCCCEYALRSHMDPFSMRIKWKGKRRQDFFIKAVTKWPTDAPMLGLETDYCRPGTEFPPSTLVKGRRI